MKDCWWPQFSLCRKIKFGSWCPDGSISCHTWRSLSWREGHSRHWIWFYLCDQSSNFSVWRNIHRNSFPSFSAKSFENFLSWSHYAPPCFLICRALESRRLSRTLSWRWDWIYWKMLDCLLFFQFSYYHLWASLNYTWNVILLLDLLREIIID